MKTLSETAASRMGSSGGGFDVTTWALAQSGLVAGFAPDDLDWVARRARIRSLRAGTDVFTESEPCEGLWIVAAGHVRLYHSYAEGRQQVVGFLAAGSSLDLATAIDGGPYATSATAMDDSVLVFLTRESLGEIAARYPEVMRNAMWQLCMEVRRHDIASAVATQKDARGRIGCTLMQLARQHGVREGKVLRIDCRLTRQDMADRAGVRIETAIRVLSDLQRQGIIRTRAQVIEILEVTQLRRPAECDDCLFDCSVFSGTRAEDVRSAAVSARPAQGER